MIPSIVITFALSLGIINVAFNQESAFAVNHNIPITSLEYNGGKIDLTPLINIKDKILTKINSPEIEPEEGSVIYSIHNGDKISFNLDEKPSRVDAFLIDYEAEFNTLYALEKLGDTEFIAKVPSPGIYNAEIHALYPDGEYTSYSKMMKIEDDEMDLLKLSSQDDNCREISDIDKVTASGNPTNLLNNITNQSIIKEFTLGAIDELHIDLGQNKDVCGLQMGLANSENDINFFAVQFSNDGDKYEDPIVFSNTGYGEAPEIYNYPSSIEAKFLKVVPLGSTLEKGFGIEDLKIIGR